MKEKLIQLGLNENQAKVWLAVRQYGLSPASQISSVTGLERTHAYKTLQQLVEKQIVQSSIRGKTHYFYIPDKGVLNELLEKQKYKLRNNEKCLLSLEKDLDTLINPEESLVPPIRQRTGTQGVRTGFQDCILTTQNEGIQKIDCFGSKTLESLATSSENMGEKRESFFASLKKNNILIKGYEGAGILILEKVIGGLDQKDFKELPTGKHALQVIIVASHIYFVFSRREPVMLKISSPEIGELIRLLLEKSIHTS